MEKDHKISYNSLMKTARGNPFYALSQYNFIVRKAAAKARGLLLAHGENIHASDCLFSIMARAHFSNDFSLAKFLIANYALAREHLQVQDSTQHGLDNSGTCYGSGSSIVRLRAPANFF